MDAVHSAATRADMRTAAPEAAKGRTMAPRFAVDQIAKRGPLIEYPAGRADQRKAFEEQVLKDQTEWLKGLGVDGIWHNPCAKKCLKRMRDPEDKVF